MPRWEPNTRMRLVEAALELFEARGYDATSVKAIAERAGVTKTTFFRQFADKREVLSAGQEEHSILLGEAIAAASPSATPLRAVEAALVTLAAQFPRDRRGFAARVQTVTNSHDELRERSGLKHADYEAAMRKALADRDVPETTAAVAVSLGLLAFHTAFSRWIERGGASLEDLVREALDDVVAASRSLDAGHSRAVGHRARR